ncbi:MAG: BON domain-containing protein [Pseudomonadota bacterium]|nr:BON domain-containing protein [Pseudomonadota bacterium]
MHRYLFCSLFFLCTATHAQTDPVGNWFHDPFFQIAAQIAACPQPVGPAIARSQMREQAHQRIERGTSCWLAHEREKPNAYAYDPEIASAIKALVEAQPQLLSGSLWITVQRRIVWLDGCTVPDATPAALAAALKALPNVESVVVRTSTFAP